MSSVEPKRLGQSAAGNVQWVTGATTAPNTAFATVSNGGQALINSIYIEANGSIAQALNLSDKGKLTIGGTHFSYYDSSKTPTYLLDGFNGQFTMVGGMDVEVATDGPTDHTYELTGNGTNTDCLVIQQENNGSNSGDVWHDLSYPAAQASYFQCGSGNVSEQTSGALPTAQFVLDQLAYLRSLQIAPPTAAPSGVTNVRLYRMMVSTGAGPNALVLQAGSSTGQVEAPSFSPVPGEYDSAQTVTISTITGGATIRYTTDGSTPSETNGTVGTTVIINQPNTVLKAIAYEAGMTDSPISCGTYAINVATPSFSPGPGNFTTAQTVTISTTTSGATIRYTTDGSTPSETNGTIYSSAINITSPTTLKAIAYKSGVADSSVQFGIYSIQCIAPTFSPGGGTFATAQSVTISTTTTGATIRYTTDGSAPGETQGTVYSSPVLISTNGYLRAIAYKSGLADSSVAISWYSIQCVAPTFTPAAGNYSSAQTVTISTTTTGASIRYTMDGTTPNDWNRHNL